jgi:hypothetical protein
MEKTAVLIFVILTFLFFTRASAQNPSAEAVAEPVADLPYREIPAYPYSYTAETVAARMVDGLGFRYFWATEGLRPEDLAYRPGAGARTSEETLDHILGLSTMILNAVKQQPNLPGGEQTLSFAAKRQRTLENLQTASDLLKHSGGKLADYNIVFGTGESQRELPFWNLLNGPVADALWHVGQVVSFRRASGNPFNGKVSVLMGSVRE